MSNRSSHLGIHKQTNACWRLSSLVNKRFGRQEAGGRSKIHEDPWLPSADKYKSCITDKYKVTLGEIQTSYENKSVTRGAAKLVSSFVVFDFFGIQIPVLQVRNGTISSLQVSGKRKMWMIVMRVCN